MAGVGSISGVSRSRGPKLGVLERWSHGHRFYPGSGPLDGGKTLGPALDIIHMGIVQSTYVYHEMIIMNMRLSID